MEKNSGGFLVGKKDGKVVAHNQGDLGGFLVGKRHSEGGIKGHNESTGQPIEVESGEIEICKGAVNSNKKQMFNGTMMTNREILSKLNQEGGGVAFEDGGNVEDEINSKKIVKDGAGKPIEYKGGEVILTRGAVSNSKKYDFNGRQMTTRQIASHINQEGGGVSFEVGGDTNKTSQDHFSTLSHKSYEVGGVLDINKLNPTEMFILHKLDNNIHSKCDIHRNKLSDLHHLEKLGIVYTTQTGKHDCYHVRLTDYGMEVLENTDIPVGHFAKGGSTADCGCNHKYDDGGNVSRIVMIPTFVVKEITDSVKMGYDTIVEGMIGRKRKGVALINKDYQVRGTYDIGLKDAIQDLIEKIKSGNFKIDAVDYKYDLGGGVDVAEPSTQYKYFKGINAKYKNQFEINKAIEELVDNIPADKLTADEKGFLKYYSGYGGLEKYGATGKGIKYEFFTPSEIALKMWGLAYKYGFKGGNVLEPACGIGEFFKYAPDQSMITGYDINDKIIKICQILYPQATLYNQSFETLFIKNNRSIKDNIQGLKKYQLVIGNPPYGSYNTRLAGLGEKDYTNANNFIDYFISRGLDLLEKNGLLIFIIGTEVAVGGTPFLQQPMNYSKKMILSKGELLDAYRLPNGLFERTDVVTDIVVFRKK